MPQGDALTLVVFAAMAVALRGLRWVYDAGYCAGIDQARRDQRWARAHRCHVHHIDLDDQPASVLPEQYLADIAEAKAQHPSSGIEDHARRGFQP
jgi:hypothetical protein